MLNKNDEFLKSDIFVLNILGTLNSIAMIGPILGFTTASLFAKMYVDVGYVDLSKYNQNRLPW